MRRPYIVHRGVEIAVALGLIVGGFCLLHDAYQGRGIRPPWIVRALTPN